jgi:uncharacterized protein (DUF433 family)
VGEALRRIQTVDIRSPSGMRSKRREALKTTAVVAPPQIIVDENGVAWIEDTTTKVIELALTKKVTGWTPEKLQAELPHLSLAQIHAALAFYHANRDELDREIERRKTWAEEMAAQAGESPFVKRMRAIGKLP